MQMITLTEIQFKNYSRIHSKRNYMQTVEYANVMTKYGYAKLYLGLIDEFNNVIAATLILEKRIKGKYKVGYIPNGFLIDFDNEILLNNFTVHLKDYLNKLNFIYVRLEPNFAYKVMDKNNNIIKNNINILDNMRKLGYLHIDNKNQFNVYSASLNCEDNIDNLYKNFNRNFKRKIKDSKLMGITYYKEDNIEEFYNLIIKKNVHSIDYYRNLKECFNNNDCKFEIFFCKINPENYLNNYRELLNKEKDRNYLLQEKIKDINVKKTKKLLDSKMKSDKLINKYQSQVIKASKLFSKYPNEFITAACAIIRTNNAIYFIDEGYEDKIRDIYSLNILKWEVIKGYCKKGYKVFDLGKVPSLKRDKENHFHGLYFSITSFNPKILEHCGCFDLVINKYIYGILKKFD